VTLSRHTIALKEAIPTAASLVVETATVTNTGKVAATEVVQCYVGNGERVSNSRCEACRDLRA
jgi:hypothetical protein